MQKKIDKLIYIINNSLMKLSDKNACFELLSEMIQRYNYNEIMYHKRLKCDLKIKSDFIDYFDRATTILYLHGWSENEIMGLNFKYYSWLIEHLKEYKKQLTQYAINQIVFYLELYENCYDCKLPENVSELKKFILEPFEIEEETFDIAYKNALNDFKNTGKISEILKIGWLKELTGQIKTTYLIKK